MAKAIFYVMAFLAGGGMVALLGSTQETTKKDDVLSVLLRMERRQIADLHPRLFKHGFMPEFCDSDEFCRYFEVNRAVKFTVEERPKAFDEIEVIKGKAFRDRFERYVAEQIKKSER